MPVNHANKPFDDLRNDPGEFRNLADPKGRGQFSGRLLTGGLTRGRIALQTERHFPDKKQEPVGGIHVRGTPA
ncbi:MAG: hypothetical protein V3S45_06570 [Kiloniellales bacterium]